MAIRKRVWVSGGKERTAWMLDYRDQHGRRRAQTFRTKREAEKAAHRIGVAVERGDHVAPSDDLTVGALADQFLAEVARRGRTAGTQVMYRQHVDLHVKPRLGAVKLQKLTARAVSDWERGLADDGVSPAMRRKLLVTLRSILRHGQAMDLVTRNPAQAVQVLDRHDREEVATPTAEEVAAIIAAAPSQRWKTLWTVAASTGMRAGEFRALTWGDVEFDAGVVHVRRRADEAGRFGPPKTRAGKRSIPMSTRLGQTLREWRLASGRPADDALVFPTRSGAPMRLTSIRRNGWVPTLKAAGLMDGDTPRFNIHSLRHHFASALIASGFNAKRVQVLLGHADPQVTLTIYSRAWSAQGQDQAGAQAELDRALGHGV